MSRKVNNLRKRLRQVEQQNEKQLRSLSLRERDLLARETRCKQIESRKPPTVDDGIVSLIELLFEDIMKGQFPEARGL